MAQDLWLVLGVSLKVALIATVVVMVVGISLALVLAHKRSFVAKLVEMAIYLPMAMPPVALGYGLLLVLGRRSTIGNFIYHAFGIHISFTMIGAIVASCAASLGIGLRAMKIAIEGINQEEIEVASLLGARRLQILRHIVLPQCLPSLAGGALLVFLRVLSEFGATIVLAGNTLGETRTLALAIWVGMEMPNQEHNCLLLVLVALSIAFSALLIAEFFLRRAHP
jgi:molybdate transport system permease protein